MKKKKKKNALKYDRVTILTYLLFIFSSRNSSKMCVVFKVLSLSCS